MSTRVEKLIKKADRMKAGLPAPTDGRFGNCRIPPRKRSKEVKTRRKSRMNSLMGSRQRINGEAARSQSYRDEYPIMANYSVQVAHRPCNVSN